ncbi:hypothetical protein ACFRAI_41295 [Streptomyces sp. NPDC056637]|uniref:hypothetical protein n=1 Tax=unclassified Streptomyces TaxID=2593676 RepID=UPI003638CDDD
MQVSEVKALACQLPAETGTPLSRWSCPELAREVVVRRIAGSISDIAALLAENTALREQIAQRSAVVIPLERAHATRE